MMDNVWSVQEILNGAVGGNYAFCLIEHENYKGLLWKYADGLNLISFASLM